MHAETLLLIPGLLCDERLWRKQIDGLGNCFQIVVADVTRHESVCEMAQAVIDRAPQSFCLAGFSLGSQVALEIVGMAKERVEKLALLSATNRGLLPPVRAAIENAIATIEEGRFDDYLEQAYSSYVHPLRAGDVVLRRTFTEMARVVGPEAGIRQMRALLSIRAPFTHLDQIDCPTAIIAGEGDQRTPPAAHLELAREIRNSVLTIIPDSGHFTPIEQPDGVTEAMRAWLTA